MVFLNIEDKAKVFFLSTCYFYIIGCGAKHQAAERREKG